MQKGIPLIAKSLFHGLLNATIELVWEVWIDPELLKTGGAQMVLRTSLQRWK